MKNKEQWQPSKYIFRKQKLISSRDQNEVSIGSRLTTDLTAEHYDKNLKLYAKGKLLDLGCGNVPLYDAYKEHITENICVDWENTLHKNEYLDFECDLTQDLPFSNEEFDTIILSDVLEHIPQPEIIWKELSRILSKKGTILINVPFYYWLHERPYDYYRYTEFSLKRFIDNSGLRLIQLESTGGSPEIIADILAKHFQFIPVIGKPLARAIQHITMLFVRTTLGRKISKKTAEAFPFGYFLIATKDM